MIAVYVRESSDAQKGNWNHLEQRAAAIEWARSIKRDDYKIYEDIASGKKGSVRRNYDKMKDDIRAGKIDTVYFWKFERLGRRAAETELLKELLLEHNVKFFDGESARFLNLEDAGDDMNTSIRGKLAEIDNKRRIEYTRKGVKKAHDSGDRRYGKLYGYTATATIEGSKVKRSWHIAESEAKVIRLIFSLAIKDRLGLSAICRHVNDAGFRTRKGELWTHDKVRQLLRHAPYAGLTHDSGGELIESKVYPAIVDRAEWEELQIKYPAWISSGKKGRPGEHIASGLMYCAECGALYTYWGGYGIHKRADGSVHRYDKISYVHSARITCSGRKYYKAELIDRIVTSAYMEGIFRSETIIKNLLAQTGTEELREQHENFIASRAGIEKQRENLKKAITMGALDESIISDLNFKVKEIAVLTAKIEEIEAQTRERETTKGRAIEALKLHKGKELLEGTDRENNVLIKEIIKKVELKRDTVRVIYIDDSEAEYDYIAAGKSIWINKLNDVDKIYLTVKPRI